MSSIHNAVSQKLSGNGFKAVNGPLDERKTPWMSIWICIFMQFIVGIQMSMYYLSMWPYLHGMDDSASIDFLGWVVASCSFACAVANPIFGYWNEKTMSVTHPTIFGFITAAIGQLIYGLLPLFSSNQKWIMLLARILTGFGTGSFSVLRTYTSTAPLPEDKLASISYGTAGYVLGITVGRAIQASFTSVGSGWKIGSLPIDMYTLPAFVMVVLVLVSCPIMLFFLKEDYAGIINEKDQEATNVVIPKYDLPAALICAWNWLCICIIATNVEVMSTPLTSAMYAWNDSTAVFNNGIIQSVSCMISVLMNIFIGYTWIGKIDKRKQIVFGLVAFLVYQAVYVPWPFYSGPLKYIPAGRTTEEIGGCDPSYKWCETTVAVPQSVYVFCYIFVCGIAFPFIGAPSSSLYSEILGPRPQGIMQGMYSFGGSTAQFAVPILSTILFKHTGYIWIVLFQTTALSVALISMLFFYRRLKALELLPADGNIVQIGSD